MLYCVSTAFYTILGTRDTQRKSTGDKYDEKTP
jgi:hypothetical protein